jgi:hypothetical protein
VIFRLERRTCRPVTRATRSPVALSRFVHAGFPVQWGGGVAGEKPVMAGAAIAPFPGGMTGVIEDNIARTGDEGQFLGRVGAG